MLLAHLEMRARLSQPCVVYVWIKSVVPSDNGEKQFVELIEYVCWIKSNVGGVHAAVSL